MSTKKRIAARVAPRKSDVMALVTDEATAVATKNADARGQYPRPTPSAHGCGGACVD